MAFRTNKMPVLQEKSASGSIATFNTALAMPLKSCTSLISGYQEGTGTPSPSNVRNLVSFSSASLYVSAKNIIDINDAHITSQTFSSNIFLKAGTYTLSANYNNVSNIIGYLRLNTRYEPITQLASLTLTPNDSGRSSASFTLENDSSCRLVFQGASVGYDFYVSNIMLEVGDSETSFEPYNGNTHLFTFGTDIYSGSIDWKRGVVVGNEVVFNAWNTLSFYYNSTQHFYRADISNMLANNDSTRSNIYNYVDKLWGSLVDYEFGVAGIQIRFHNETVSSSQELVNLLISQGVEIKYPLDNPITIPLGGVNLLTQQGQNNIFCDTGDIDLTYKDLDIAKRGNFREVFKLPS